MKHFQNINTKIRGLHVHSNLLCLQIGQYLAASKSPWNKTDRRYDRKRSHDQNETRLLPQTTAWHFWLTSVRSLPVVHWSAPWGARREWTVREVVWQDRRSKPDQASSCLRCRHSEKRIKHIVYWQFNVTGNCWRIIFYVLPVTLVKHLQAVLNASARLVTETRRFDHIIPVLNSLDWLSYHNRIKYKVCTNLPMSAWSYSQLPSQFYQTCSSCPRSSFTSLDLSWGSTCSACPHQDFWKLQLYLRRYECMECTTYCASWQFAFIIIF